MLSKARKKLDGCLPAIFKIFFVAAMISIAMVASGCGALSATTLRCGTDGDASYVEVVSAPQAISSNVRALSELCGFAYIGGDSET